MAATDMMSMFCRGTHPFFYMVYSAFWNSIGAIGLRIQEGGERETENTCEWQQYQNLRVTLACEARTRVSRVFAEAWNSKTLAASIHTTINAHLYTHTCTTASETPHNWGYCYKGSSTPAHATPTSSRVVEDLHALLPPALLHLALTWRTSSCA